MRLSSCLLDVRSDSVDGALFWAVVSLSGLGLTTANNLALCRMTLIPKQAAGLATGVQNVSTSLAGIVGPILTGWLLQTTCIVLLRPEWSPKVVTIEVKAAA